MSATLPPSEPSHVDGEVVPVPGVVPAEHMEGEDEEDMALLQEMLESAKNYVQSFSWCQSVQGSYFAGGVGGILAIFLFKISPARPDVDKWMWIVVGDVPLAYFPLEDCRTGEEVFDTYIDGMKRWVKLARVGRTATPNDNVPPVNVPSTSEWAEALDGRLRSLPDLIRPILG